MVLRKKYAISEIIREARQRKYKTAKDFWSENEKALGASYTHYAAIETGTKLPDIELTISVSKILKIDLRLICHLWAKDQMPTGETKAFFEPIPGREVQGIPSTIQMNLDEFFVFTEKHIPMLRKHPKAWSILSFILAFSETTPPNAEQIKKLFDIVTKDLEEILDWARNEGLVIVEAGRLRTRRRFFHLPNTIDFKEVRDANFVAVSQELLQKITSEQLKEKEAARITYMRRITKLQAQEISRHIDDLIGHFGNTPDLGQEFYAMTVAFGPRLKFDGTQDA
jgi:DNA-directed RNA polymerase subunit F